MNDDRNPPINDDIHAACIAAVATDRDKAAFSALYNHFAPRLKSFFIRQGTNGATAEELVQEAMLSLWRRADTYRPDAGRVSTWIYSIARNAAIDRFRREGRPEVHLDEVEYELEQTGEDSQSNQVYRQERFEQLQIALATLPPEQAQIIGLFYYGSKSAAQIADELELPVGTVKSRIRLALNRLRGETSGGQNA
ncbi:MAG: sigma-70 family RNA polymerase sigma factor [Gammaproteobacteria bacterium]|nr:sigma-70 family RNA polymerase sigma factor [Gammaproteobacteria bacterium]